MKLEKAVDLLANVARETRRTSAVFYHPHFMPRISLITLYNPLKLNAMTVHMINDLSSIISIISSQSSSQIISDTTTTTTTNNTFPSTLILTGYGNNFCSGFDVSNDLMNTSETGKAMSLVLQHTLHSLSNLPLVSVSAIDGVSYGGGAELAVSTDLRCLSTRASIQFLHRKMGVVPGWSGAFRLSQLCGRVTALKLLGTMCKVDTVNPYNLVDSIHDSSTLGCFKGKHELSDWYNNNNNNINNTEILEMDNINPVVWTACELLELYLGHKYTEVDSFKEDAYPLGLADLKYIKQSINIAHSGKSMDHIIQDTAQLFSLVFGSTKNRASIQALFNRSKRRQGGSKL